MKYYFRYNDSMEIDRKGECHGEVFLCYGDLMSFSAKEIEAMLKEYEADYHTGMDVAAISRLLYDYTSGYPYLVSRICQITDERIVGGEMLESRAKAWTKEGMLLAVKWLLKEPNTLFDDMTKKLLDYPGLKEMIQSILFGGVGFPFKRETPLIDLGVTFGFLKENQGIVAVANRIFEIQLYETFLAEMAINGEKMYTESDLDKGGLVWRCKIKM